MVRNLQYQWCEPTGATDKEFLGWIYQRLHDVFGERMTLDYMRRLDKVIQDTPGIIPDRVTKILENSPALREQREAFRKALADLGHSEATIYSHWALEAFDKAFRLREPE